MAGFFSKLFGSSQTQAIGVDIGSSALKVVQLKKGENGTPELETYGVLALGPYAGKHIGGETDLKEKKLASALSDLLKEANTTTSHGGVSLPFSSTLINVLELPHVSDEELGKMVPLEARKYIPVSMSEVDMDWTVIGQPETTNGNNEETVKVLTVAVHNSVISKTNVIISKAGLENSFLEVELFSTIRSTLSEQDGAALVLDMGAATTKLYVVIDQIIRETHTVNQGSQDMTRAISDSLEIDLEAAEMLKRGMIPEGQTQDRREEAREAAADVLDAIISEALYFHSNFAEKENRQMDTVVLVGGGAQYEGLRELTEKQFEIPVKLGNPFDAYTTPEGLEDALAEMGPEFAVAAGLAERGIST